MSQAQTAPPAPAPSSTPSTASDAKSAPGAAKQSLAGKPFAVQSAMLQPHLERIRTKTSAYLSDKLGAEGLGILSSKKLRTFHEAVSQAAGTRARHEADKATQGESEELREDARARSEEKAQDTVGETIGALAERGAKESMKAADAQGQLQQAGVAAADLAKDATSKEKAAEKGLDKAHGQVQEAVLTKAKEWREAQLTDDSARERAQRSAKRRVTKSQVGSEAAKLSAANKLAVENAVAKCVVPALSQVTAAVTKHIAHAIGAKSAHWWRSPEVKAFRAKMKDAGRSQAYGDIDDVLSDPKQSGVEGLAEAGKATQAYMAVAAKEDAYARAKGSVNSAMQEMAAGGAGEVVDKADVKSLLEKGGRSAGFLAYREDDELEDVAPEVARGITIAIPEAKTKAKAEADSWSQALMALSDGDLDDQKKDVAAKVESDEVGKKSVTHALKANTTAEGMAAIGRLCDTLVPNRGDGVSLSVELNIPIPNSPAYVLLRFAGECERGITNKKGAKPGMLEDKSLSVQAEFHLGAGAELIGVKADGSIGFFVKAEAADTQKTFQVLNYGAYRSACQISDKVADWWGGSGKAEDTRKGGHGKSATERAELWAAMVEENCFMKKNPNFGKPKKGEDGKPIAGGGIDMREKIPDDDTSVDIGGALTGRAKVKATEALEVEGELRAEAYAHYDGEVIDKAMKAKGNANVGIGKGGTTLADAQERRQTIKPKAQGGVSLEGGVSIGIGKQKLEAGGKLEIGSEGWGFEASTAFKFDSTAGQGKNDIADRFIGSGLNMLRSLLGVYQGQAQAQTKGQRAAKGVGTALDLGDKIENIYDMATGKATSELGKLYTVKPGESDAIVGQTKADVAKLDRNAGVAAESKLELTLEIGGDFWTLENFNLTASEVTTRTVNVEAGTAALEIELEKSRKLGQVGLVDGKMQVEAMGFGVRQGDKKKGNP